MSPHHDLVDEVQALLIDHQKYHSEFQMDRFITVKSGGTTYGMYRQALRELARRFRNLKNQYIEQSRLVVDIKEIRHQIEKGRNDESRPLNRFDKERLELDLASKTMDLEEAQRGTADLTREFLHFKAQAEALHDALGPINAANRPGLDRAMWKHKMKQRIALDLWANGRLTSNVLDNIVAMPEDDMHELLAFGSDRGNAMAWLPTSFNGLPEYTVPDIEAATVQELLTDGADDSRGT